MPQYRADFDVSSTIVFAEGCQPLVIKNDEFEIIIKNADLDSDGNIPGLKAQVVSNAVSMDDAQAKFRELLAQQLDLLTFTTHSQFKINQCYRLSEWEPYQKERKARVMQRFDRHYPPLATFSSDLQETVKVLSASPRDSYIQKALNYFRKGTISEQLEDQFHYFWLAIEVIAEGNKSKAKGPIPCPVCKDALQCKNCNCEPQRTPMARQAIKTLLNAINSEGDKLYKLLIDARDGIMHGRTQKSISDQAKIPFAGIVNEAGIAAWHTIQYVFSQSDGLTFGHNDGDFAFAVMVVGPDIIYRHEGTEAHPTDDKIPTVNISLKASLKPFDD